MANERRLISADALVVKLELLARHEDGFRQSAILGVVETIKRLPTVDAVEVVHCRDCKFFQTFGHSEKPFCQKFFGLLIKPDDFCSYGRKEEKNG